MSGSTPASPPKPFWLRCGPCSHVWAVGRALPMPSGDFARALKAARCPLCASESVFATSNAADIARGEAIRTRSTTGLAQPGNGYEVL